jgi:hypothetical protein
MQTFFYFKQGVIQPNNHFETGLLLYVVGVSRSHSSCSILRNSLPIKKKSLISLVIG